MQQAPKTLFVGCVAYLALMILFASAVCFGAGPPIAPEVRSSEPPPPEAMQVYEESRCSIIIQEFKGFRLVSLEIDFKGGFARAIYGHLVNRHILQLVLLTRTACDQPWAMTASRTVDPNPKECEPGSSCL